MWVYVFYHIRFRFTRYLRALLITHPETHTRFTCIHENDNTRRPRAALENHSFILFVSFSVQTRQRFFHPRRVTMIAVKFTNAARTSRNTRIGRLISTGYSNFECSRRVHRKHAAVGIIPLSITIHSRRTLILPRGAPFFFNPSSLCIFFLFHSSANLSFVYSSSVFPLS